MNSKKILIVDDEAEICELIQMTLEMNGFSQIRIVKDGKSAINAAEFWLPDIILLDLMLPVIDGLSVCKILKNNPMTANIPIIIITAKSTPTDIVVGLELGANDYVTKPFNNQVLLARIRNQLRQTTVEQSTSKTLTYKSLVITEDEFKVELDGEALDLTKTEFEILCMLVKSPGRVYTRTQIISNLKNGEYSDITDRAIDVQILNLRRKLGTFASNIETIRGVGYRMQQITSSGRI